jgi:hypothetical protein
MAKISLRVHCGVATIVPPSLLDLHASSTAAFGASKVRRGRENDS